MEKIDFVVLWVDGDDPQWQLERTRYAQTEREATISENRYRDWGVTKYWFRGIEKFAPWVNHIYFVTCGHYPEWLNLEHPKLTLVKHSDFIPEKYLPTFNSNVIELHIHNIPGLSEQFVLFNDDVFLTNHVRPSDFFIDGQPCETAILGQISPTEWNPWTVSVLNNITLINRHFNKREVTRRNFWKFYSPKYGKYLIQNCILGFAPHFSNFRDMHISASYLKNTFEQVWSLEPEILHNCCTHKFRSREDVTDWLMKYWQICSGQFYPRSTRWGKMFSLGKDSGWKESIRKQRYKVVCLNDGEHIDYEVTKQELQNAFASILPERSAFEK